MAGNVKNQDASKDKNFQSQQSTDMNQRNQNTQQGQNERISDRQQQDVGTSSQKQRSSDMGPSRSQGRDNTET